MATMTALRRWKPCWGSRSRRSALPQFPRLAPNVTLCGHLAESGFSDQQWLAERNGRYLQLSELVYRIAALCDGRHTTAQIADTVSSATGRRLSDDNIRRLLRRKLIPHGLVAPADGAAAPAAAGTGRGAGSPLAVQLKMAAVGPRQIDPFTAVLRYLYWPPIVLVVLATGAVGLRWLFAVHGVGPGMYAILYRPVLLLAAVGFIVLAAAFHELGHAAALRYGGGQVRGMGVGLYLVYPAFYTDVSDNYRLGRWARVRTDLGGFYFNLIFILGLLGLRYVTGWEFLLIVVVAIVFDIIRQSLPFVRLDGYWALADLTGLPDFFANIGPFLRAVLPLPFWQGRKLPPLRGWVKAVYALYLLVTVPLLLLLLILMVKSTPRILATAADSLARQAASFGLAWGVGDGWATAAAALELLTMALPTVGLLLLLASLGRTVAALLWRWSKPTPVRRAAGALVGAGMGFVLLLLWAPQIPAAIPAFGGQTGLLYQRTRTSWQPLRGDEHGRLSELLPDVSSLGRQAQSSLTAPTTGPSNGAVPLTGMPAAESTSIPATAPTDTPRGTFPAPAPRDPRTTTAPPTGVLPATTRSLAAAGATAVGAPPTIPATTVAPALAAPPRGSVVRAGAAPATTAAAAPATPSRQTTPAPLLTAADPVAAAATRTAGMVTRSSAAQAPANDATATPRPADTPEETATVTNAASATAPVQSANATAAAPMPITTTAGATTAPPPRDSRTATAPRTAMAAAPARPPRAPTAGAAAAPDTMPGAGPATPPLRTATATAVATAASTPDTVPAASATQPARPTPSPAATATAGPSSAVAPSPTAVPTQRSTTSPTAATPTACRAAAATVAATPGAAAAPCVP